MKAQLEIVRRARINGRFVKGEGVLVFGVMIGTLVKMTNGFEFRPVPGNTFTCHLFLTRDDACAWLFDRYTSEPETGAFSLSTTRNPHYPNINTSYDLAYDRYIDRLYAESDEYLMRANAPDYHAWLDSLDHRERA